MINWVNWIGFAWAIQPGIDVACFSARIFVHKNKQAIQCKSLLAIKSQSLRQFPV